MQDNGSSYLEHTSERLNIGSGLVASSASQRTTPVVGIAGMVREIKIRKGRNLRQIRLQQNHTEAESLEMQLVTNIKSPQEQ